MDSAQRADNTSCPRSDSSATDGPGTDWQPVTWRHPVNRPAGSGDARRTEPHAPRPTPHASEGSRRFKIRQVVVILGLRWWWLALLLGPGRSGTRHGCGQVFVVGALGFGLARRFLSTGGRWNGVEVGGGGRLGLRLDFATNGSASPR